MALLSDACGCDSLVQFDRSISDTRGKLLAGVDEAGRGALAGPVVAAAVVCEFSEALNGVRDSKLLGEKRREELYEIIMSECACASVGIVGPEEIDGSNIRIATLKAMKIAVEGLEKRPELVLIDGKDIPDIDIAARRVIGGDRKSFVIAASSIIAKVSRDRLMRGLETEYPGYNLTGNKGYGTLEHRKAIKKIGLTSIHRKSFKCSL